MNDPDPPRRLGPIFWLMIAFALICIAGGYGVARWGPKLLPAPAQSSAKAPA